jgi:hypothetical protein
MKSKAKHLILFAILFEIILLSVFVLPIQCQQMVPISVNRAAWGQNINAPIKVYPGAEGATLTVELQNLSPDQTLKGIIGTLNLTGSPFKDIYGNKNATSIGTPTVGDLLNPSDEVSPRAFFTMTFYLDIRDDATPDTYLLDLLVNYSASTWLIFQEGVSENLIVSCTVSAAQSALTVSASPSTLEGNDQVKIVGALQPAIEDAEVDLVLNSPNGSKYDRTVETKLDGSFNYSFVPRTAGLWTVNASWAGDTQNRGAWGTATFEVRLPIELSLTTSGDRIKAGYDNQLNLTIRNTGKVAFSTLNMSYSLPPPLVLSGKNQWTLTTLGANESYVIPLTVYAPFASIGNTFSSVLTVICRDDYGQFQSYNFPVGLVIVGNVELGVYDSVVKPDVVINGSKIEITTTLLNRGTVPALYVNASILPNPILELNSLSTVYVGDVDENSQAPFTVSANVTEGTKEGIYPVTLRIDYRNDQNIDNTFNYTFNLQVTHQTASEETQTSAVGLYETAIVAAIILVAAIAVIVVYRKTSSRKSKPNRATQ